MLIFVLSPMLMELTRDISTCNHNAYFFIYSVDSGRALQLHAGVNK